MNVTAPIRENAARIPDSPAIIQRSGAVITYAELERAIDAGARSLLRLGLEPGEVVGLRLGEQNQTTALILALSLARIGVVAAPHKIPQQHRRLVLGTLPGMVPFDRTWIQPQKSTEFSPVEIAPGGEAALRIFASSGTTGESKYMVWTHEEMDWWVTHGPSPIWEVPMIRIIAVELSTGWGMRSVFTSLSRGGTIVMSQLSEVAEHLVKHRVNDLVGPPGVLAQILDTLPDDWTMPTSLRLIETGGAALPDKLRQRLQSKLCPNILKIYGSTEAFDIAKISVDDPRQKPNSAGFVWPNSTVQAVNDRGEVLPLGQEGELRIRTPKMVKGYFADPENTARFFRDGWFYPGDVGTVWPDGQVTLSGRVNERINAGGVKINPAAIEDALMTLPGVEEAAAFGVPDENGIDQIWAAIVARGKIEDVVLHEFCKRALRDLAPVAILQLKSMPRTESGKLMRRGLAEAAIQSRITPKPGISV